MEKNIILERLIMMCDLCDNLLDWRSTEERFDFSDYETQLNSIFSDEEYNNNAYYEFKKSVKLIR